MSRAYELFYANHSLESKMEPCALCFQAAETSRKSAACFWLSYHQQHFSSAALLLPQIPCFWVCVCGRLDGKGQLSRQNNWRNSLRFLEFKMTSTNWCVLYQIFRSLFMYLLYVRKSGLLWKQTANSGLLVMRPHFFFCGTVHGLTWD